MNLLKMKNDQEEFYDYRGCGFEPTRTQDGSFTLKQQGLSESMHSSGGAVSESYFIYHEALKMFFKNCGEAEEVEVLSVGLGLGYNEILTAQAQIETLNETKSSFKLILDSYEKEQDLVDLFLKRIRAPQNYKNYWRPFVEKGLLPEEVSKLLKKSLNFKGAFGEESLKNLRNLKKIILFDAYSKQTSAELWSESFLEEVFEKCGQGSVVVTYAANSSINRPLKKAGFINLKKDGFLGKRQSTLAIKNMGA